MRERLVGELRWNQNMEVYGEGGALFFLLEPLAPRLAFGMTSGGGKWLLQ